jgi:hypothetical protein
VLHDAAAFFTAREGNWTAVDGGPKEIPRPLFAPLTYAGRVYGPNDLQWVVVVASTREGACLPCFFPLGQAESLF